MHADQHPLKKLLERDGILQKDLPDLLNQISDGKVKVTPSAVSNWLSGRNAISEETRPFLAKLFGVPPEAFAPQRAAVEPLGIGTAVLGDSVKPGLPLLEVELSVRAMTPGEPPLYRTRFVLQVEDVDGENLLIARETTGRDPRNLSVEVGGETIKGADITDRVDATNLGQVERLLSDSKALDQAPGAVMILRVPLRVGALRGWLGGLSRQQPPERRRS